MLGKNLLSPNPGGSSTGLNYLNGDLSISPNRIGGRLSSSYFALAPDLIPSGMNRRKRRDSIASVSESS